jgi:hypothetical protein
MASIRVCPETLTPTSRSAPPALRIPGSFVYFANRDSDTGQKLARPLGRFAAGPLAQADAPWPGGIDSRYLSWSLVAAFGPTDRDDRARKAAEQRIVGGPATSSLRRRSPPTRCHYRAGDAGSHYRGWYPICATSWPAGSCPDTTAGWFPAQRRARPVWLQLHRCSERARVGLGFQRQADYRCRGEQQR